MTLIRRTRPALVPQPAPQPEPEIERRSEEIADRRIGTRRRLVTSGRISAQDILERAATRAVVPTSTNSTMAREKIHRAAGLLVNEQLQLVAMAERDIDDAQLRLTQAHAEVDRIMRGAIMPVQSDGVYVAEIAETFTRQSRTVDPKKFKHHVPDKVFWDSIKVNLEKAESHLSKKEMDEITEVVEGKSNGYSLKIKKLDIKRRTK